MGCDIHLAVELRTAGGWVPQATTFGGRRYGLFAALADVRNDGDSFGPVEPIARPRGLPDDVSGAVRAESDDWGVDGHSHSWFTLSELLGHDWDVAVPRTCWVRRHRDLPPARQGWSPDDYADHLQSATRSLQHLPSAESWGYETCSWSSEGQGRSGWRTISWHEPLGDLVGTEWWRLVALMARLAGDDLTTVRIVFWFDN